MGVRWRRKSGEFRYDYSDCSGSRQTSAASSGGRAMVTRRQFLLRAGSVGVCLAGAKLAVSAFPDDDQLPDGSQSRGMITRAAQEAIDRGLAYLSSQQHEDGSFGTLNHHGNVAITSVAGLAFMAGGNQPGRGRYG